MDIYVQSRGISQGYSWLKITENDKREEPPIPNHVYDLIDTDSHSIVLGQFNGNLILLVTGLETSNRTDNRHRTIRNSIAWIAQKNEELNIRLLTVEALQDSLKRTIDEAVSSGGDKGFKVSLDLVKKLPQLNNFDTISFKLEDKFENLQTRKQLLAKEIVKLESLPFREGLFVVVAEANSQKNWEQEGVWYNFSNQTSLENKKMEGSNKLVKTQSWNLLKSSLDWVKKKFTSIPKGLLITIIFISLSVNIFLLSQLLVKTESQRIDYRLEQLKYEQQNLQNNAWLKEKEIQEKERELQILQNHKHEIETKLDDIITGKSF
jgi:hypothetical protein